MTILEFNEEQQRFHYNDIIDGISKTKENTYGWKTLVICKDDNEASLFAAFLQKQFIERNIKLKFPEAEYTVKNICLFLGRKMQMSME